MNTLPWHKRSGILYLFKLVFFSTLLLSSFLTVLDTCFSTRHSSSVFILTVPSVWMFLPQIDSLFVSFRTWLKCHTRESFPDHCSENNTPPSLYLLFLFAFLLNEDRRCKIDSILPPASIQTLCLQAHCFVSYFTSNSWTEPITDLSELILFDNNIRQEWRQTVSLPPFLAFSCIRSYMHSDNVLQVISQCFSLGSSYTPPEFVIAKIKILGCAPGRKIRTSAKEIWETTF